MSVKQESAIYNGKIRNAKYTVRLSSPRILPDNSLSQPDWNIDTLYIRKNLSSDKKKRIKYTIMILTISATIAVLVAIAVIIPSTIQSKMTTIEIAIATSSFNTNFNATPNSGTSTFLATSSSPVVTAFTTLQITTTTTTTTTTTFSPTCAFRWYANGTTVAGKPGYSSATDEYLGLTIGLFFDSPNTLYASDGSNHRIQRFTLGNITGTRVAGQANASGGTGVIRLQYPSDMALDSKGNLYIADSQNHRIQLWRVNATVGQTIAGNGSYGSALNQLNSPRSIVIDRSTDDIYVSDGGNHRIMKYTLNSTVGTIVAGGNGEGTNDNQLFQPRGLHFDNFTKSLIIANYGAHNILRWKLGDSNWTLIAGEFNASVNVNQSRGNTPTRFNSPWEAILDPVGNLYVADRYNHRIQFFRRGELNGTTIAGITSTSGTAAYLLNQPLSLTFDNELNFYVSDSGNNRIQKFTCY